MMDERRNIKLVMSILLTILFSVIICAQVDDIKSISNNEFLKKMNDTSVVILDVRTPAELKGPLGQLDGVINIPLQELDKRIGELNKYKEEEIMVLCRTGKRSKLATEILKKNGFNVINVLGGMTEYRENQKKQKRRMIIK